jgi:hypothetical protein
MIDFAVVEKTEVGNVNNRMELEGVKRCLDSLKSDVNVKGSLRERRLQKSKRDR